VQLYDSKSAFALLAYATTEKGARKTA